jgi:hypothetical protein
VNKLNIDGIELTFENEREILGMGGPFIGDFFIKDNLIASDSRLDSFLYEPNKNLLFFIKFHAVSQYYYFTINFYGFQTNSIFEFEREFRAVHFGGFVTPTQLEIYPAFHDKLYNKSIFDIDNEDFYPVEGTKS